MAPRNVEIQLELEGEIGRRFSATAAAYAEKYSQENSPTGLVFRRRQSLVMSLLRPLRRGAILDVGCGPGIYAAACVAHGLAYRGLDASRGMVDECRRRFGQLEDVDFFVGNAKRLPFRSESFDAALCLGVLEYVRAQDDAACLNELIRVVKPGGLIAFSFLNRKSPFWLWCDWVYPVGKFLAKNFAAVLGKAKWTPLRDCRYERELKRRFGLNERLDSLRSLGCFVVEHQYFSLNAFPPPFSRWFHKTSVWVSLRLEPVLSGPMFGWLGTAFVISVRTPERALDARGRSHAFGEDASMNTTQPPLDELLAQLRHARLDRALDQVEPRVWAWLAAGAAGFQSLLWSWRASLAAAALALGVVLGGYAAGPRPLTGLTLFSPFSAHAELAPSTLLETTQ